LVPVLAMAAAIRSRIPFIVTFHTGGHSSPVRSRIRYLQWRLLAPLLRRADMLIAVSRFEAAYFQRVLSVPADRIVVIRNGGSLPRTAAVDAPTGPPLLTSVGRLERYKGHHRLIAALPHVLQHYPEARVRILGTGPYKAELEAHAARLGVAERVEIGYVPGGDRAAMAKAISESTLIVMLSDYEAHPVAVMEALTLGRPVLVSRTSGLTELADDGLASCVPATANAQATAAAIVDLLRSPPAPTQITIPTWESCTDELRDVYAGLTATR
jgi:glycosyltransferase involved in cell wall biosynthesis